MGCNPVTQRTNHCKLNLFFIHCFLSLLYGVSSTKSYPEVSSTVLKMHQLYMKQPPHDTSLYDLLEVSPNATSAEISKSFRKICRRLHPDKRRKLMTQDNHSLEAIAADCQQQLELIRSAYDILKHDSTRLPYHRHGLLNPMDAVYILTGSVGRQFAAMADDDPKQALQMELLELMGYYHYPKNNNNKMTLDHSSFLRPDEGDERSRRDRILYIAASLMERTLPVLEGTLAESVFLDHLIQQCDRWKSLPLGAQIVRCIGRAYRYSGERFLRRGLPLAIMQDNVRGVVRQAKYFATAAVAGGRVVLEERKVKQKSLSNGSISKQLHWEENMEQTTMAPAVDETIRQQELYIAHQALLESLQVEALWKICKIDLDRTIRTACGVLLAGNGHPLCRGDGWVGANGNIIVAHNGRVQLALLLIRMGNIMVHRSKEGTSWME